MKSVIVTADDFGLSAEVNEAVERAHRDGILTTASLMVGAPGTADAVARARRLPSLRVGLHVVVVNGRPVLPPQRVPQLVDARGEFPSDLFRAGVAMFFGPGARRQLEAEIGAQFEAFARTGLALDHVNAQNHMHVHPTVFSTIVRVGRRYGMRSVRLPREPFVPSWRSAPRELVSRLGSALFLAPWLALLSLRMRCAGLAHNDYVFGMNDTGRMTSERVLRIIEQLPDGVTELYFHPVLGDPELAALVDPTVAAALRAVPVSNVNFTELALARAS